MLREYKRQTIGSAFEIEGPGLHSGEATRVRVESGRAGIIFRLGGDRVEAKPENVTDTQRCTRLGGISTVEHLMSAFAAHGITDAEVEVTTSEMPAADGCAMPYFAAIAEAGIEEIGRGEMDGPYARVFTKDDAPGTEIAIATGEGHWRYEFFTELSWCQSQIVEWDGANSTYGGEIARARTFCFETELPMIEKYGLGKGLDETTCLVLGSEGYVNSARFSDEPARHKLLDLIGDIYLAGVPVTMLNVVAMRSGHRLNVQAAVRLSQAVRFSGK